MELVPFEETPESPPSLCAQRGHVNTQQEGTHPWAKRKRSQNEVYIAGNLILDFPASSTVKNKFLFFKPPSVWYLVTAAQADQYSCISNSDFILWLPWSPYTHLWKEKSEAFRMKAQCHHTLAIKEFRITGYLIYT